MEISINVLPDEQKAKWDEEKKISLILKLGFSFVAVLLILNIVLALMQVVLGIEYQTAKKESEYSFTKKAAAGNQPEKVFQETNSRVATLLKIKSSIPQWTRVLAKISQILPEEIRLNQLSAEENRLKVSGFSKTREAFLDFQEKLKIEGFQFSVDISNLVASRDFNFDLELTIPQDYLIRQ